MSINNTSVGKGGVDGTDSIAWTEGQPGGLTPAQLEFNDRLRDALLWGDRSKINIIPYLDLNAYLWAKESNPTIHDPVLIKKIPDPRDLKKNITKPR